LEIEDIKLMCTAAQATGLPLKIYCLLWLEAENMDEFTRWTFKLQNIPPQVSFTTPESLLKFLRTLSANDKRMMSWIIIDSDKVFEHLISKGHVYDIRFSQIDTFWGIGLLHNGKECGLVTVELVRKIALLSDLFDEEFDEHLLDEYVKDSGFDSSKEWMQALRNTSSTHFSHGNMYVYRVTYPPQKYIF
jgi:hypothetical protein